MNSRPPRAALAFFGAQLTFHRVRTRAADDHELAARDEHRATLVARRTRLFDQGRLRRRGDRIQRDGSVAVSAGRRRRTFVHFGGRRDAAAGRSGGSITMSSSGILDTLRNEERSLKSQLVAIQRHRGD